MTLYTVFGWQFSADRCTGIIVEASNAAAAVDLVFLRAGLPPDWRLAAAFVGRRVPASSGEAWLAWRRGPDPGGDNPSMHDGPFEAWTVIGIWMGTGEALVSVERARSSLEAMEITAARARFDDDPERVLLVACLAGESPPAITPEQIPNMTWSGLALSGVGQTLMRRRRPISSQRS